MHTLVADVFAKVNYSLQQLRQECHAFEAEDFVETWIFIYNHSILDTKEVPEAVVDINLLKAS